MELFQGRQPIGDSVGKMSPMDKCPIKHIDHNKCHA